MTSIYIRVQNVGKLNVSKKDNTRVSFLFLTKFNWAPIESFASIESIEPIESTWIKIKKEKDITRPKCGLY